MGEGSPEEVSSHTKTVVANELAAVLQEHLHKVAGAGIPEEAARLAREMAVVAAPGRVQLAEEHEEEDRKFHRFLVEYGVLCYKHQGLVEPGIAAASNYLSGQHRLGAESP